MRRLRSPLLALVVLHAIATGGHAEEIRNPIPSPSAIEYDATSAVSFPESGQMALYLVPAEEGRPIVIDKAVVFIGRHPDCDVVLKRSRKVSRKHCCIAQVDARLVVRDLGSMNGVRLNGERVNHEALLQIGDELVIGDVSYTLETHDQLSRRANGQRSPDQPAGAPTRPVSREPSVPPHRPPGRPIIDKPVSLSQDIPIPIPDDEGADFRVEESHDRHDPAGRSSDDGEDDLVVLSDSDEY